MAWKIQDLEREKTSQIVIPVKSPQTFHTMRFSIMKLFWAISCTSSFSAKAFFSARKDMSILKSISNTAFPSVFGYWRLATLFLSLAIHIPEETLQGSVTAFIFLTLVCATSQLWKWKLSSVIYEACSFSRYHVSPWQKYIILRKFLLDQFHQSCLLLQLPVQEGQTILNLFNESVTNMLLLI